MHSEPALSTSSSQSTRPSPRPCESVKLTVKAHLEGPALPGKLSTCVRARVGGPVLVAGTEVGACTCTFPSGAVKQIRSDPNRSILGGPVALLVSEDNFMLIKVSQMYAPDRQAASLVLIAELAVEMTRFIMVQGVSFVWNSGENYLRTVRGASTYRLEAERAHTSCAYPRDLADRGKVIFSPAKGQSPLHLITGTDEAYQA
jgi:hypothetical protein